MSNNIKWNWNDSQKVGMHDVGKGLKLRGSSRYTIRPPRVLKFETKLDLTYRRRHNQQWERWPELRDREKVWRKIADGYVWDRDDEIFLKLEVPYEIADGFGNIRLLDNEGKRYDIYKDYF
jgi:hypothetical protein